MYDIILIKNKIELRPKNAILNYNNELYIYIQIMKYILVIQTN